MQELTQYGVKIIQLDITSPESVKLLVELIELEYDGKLKYLFNNAGQPCTIPSIDVTDDQMEQCFNVNFIGQARMVRELIPFLIAAEGTIGFTGSVAATFPFVFGSMYAASKAALHLYISILALELEPLGVKVINFVTGAVKTGMAETRPIPKDSYYQLDGIKQALEAISKLNKEGMEPEVYCRQVVSDFENSKIGTLNYYRGSLARFGDIASRYLPRFLLMLIVKQDFKIGPLWQLVREKYKVKVINL